MTVREYLAKFTRLAQYATSMIQDNDQKSKLFEDGLWHEIRKIINILHYKTYETVLNATLITERDKVVTRLSQPGKRPSQPQA